MTPKSSTPPKSSTRVKVHKPHPPPSRNMRAIRRTWLAGELHYAADYLIEFGFDELGQQVYDAAIDIYERRAVSRTRRSHTKKAQK